MGLLDFLRRLFAADPGGSAEREAGPRTDPRGPGARPRPVAGNPARLQQRGLPVLATVAELAAAMGRSERELWWLGDPRGYQWHGTPAGADRSAHYRLLLYKRGRPRKEIYHCPDRSTEAGFRLEVRETPAPERPILAPRMHLKAAQRWILRNILDPCDPHPAAHGFRRGRSIRSHAGSHVGRAVVLQADLHDFFHQFTFRLVKGLFCSLGYPRPVGGLLAQLCTVGREGIYAAIAAAGRTTAELLPLFGQDRGGWRTYHRHCPQGAPTSPALANLLCRRLDRRLTGLANRFDATYTRYADDLAFSGGGAFRRDLRRFIPLLRKICRSERFTLVARKTRVARQAARQRVTGLVVNHILNVPREEYRQLRAILHNCDRHGAASQNRESHPDFRGHLLGRIAHVAAANPDRGARLRRAFDQIDWS